MMYPNTPNELSPTADDSLISNALIDAGGQLYNAQSITYYEIRHFLADDSAYNYPRIDTTDQDKIGDKFLSWLKDGSANGTGSNLYSIKGCHLLVHGDVCNTETASADASDNRSDACGETAFSVGRAAWTGTCSDWGLRKNSAIQESLHLFINDDLQDIRKMMCDGDGDGDTDSYDSHTLGERRDLGGVFYVTPMLTYHSGLHDNFNVCGSCKDGSQKDGYTQSLTTCTEDAVYYTSVC